MLQDHIISSRKRIAKNEVINVANSIKKKDIFNTNAYWEFKRMLKKKPNQLRGNQ